MSVPTHFGPLLAMLRAALLAAGRGDVDATRAWLERALAWLDKREREGRQL